MGARPGSRVSVWLVVIVAVLILIPLFGMIAMMTTGGWMMNGQMGAHMAGMMGMHGWGLLWMGLFAVVLMALVVFLIRNTRV